MAFAEGAGAGCGAAVERWLHDQNRRIWIEGSYVIWIRSRDPVPVLPSAEHDGGIDHVGLTSNAAQLPSGPRALIVEGLHLYLLGTEQAGQARLTATIAPGLAHHARRHSEREAVVQGTHEQRDNTSIISLEADQSAGIQREPCHQRRFRRDFLAGIPSARSAARTSPAVNGPPDSSSISARSVESSSNFTFSSSALTT